jgi:integrase
MRLGEAVMLSGEHIDFDRSVIRLFPIGSLRLKSEAAQREIPMHSVVHRVLSEALGGRQRGLVFKTRSGIAINPRTVNSQFVEAARSLGMNVGRRDLGLTVHALRRFFKTSCYDAGVPKPLIDRWLGHSDRGMDAFYYRTDKASQWMSRLPFEEIVGGKNAVENVVQNVVQNEVPR